MIAAYTEHPSFNSLELPFYYFSGFCVLTEIILTVLVLSPESRQSQKRRIGALAGIVDYNTSTCFLTAQELYYEEQDSSSDRICRQNQKLQVILCWAELLVIKL